MDFLALLNHIQRRALKGRRVHGIGQGHDNASTEAIAPSADRPDNAPVGYVNADMLDGFHGKQTYHGKAPGAYAGLNADQLDGIDKSLGHVSSASDFNAPPTQKAALTVTFTGVPKQNDSVQVILYPPNGGTVLTITVPVVEAVPTLANVADAVKAKLVTPATNDEKAFRALLDADPVTAAGAITFTLAEAGVRGNLYALKAAVTLAPDSSLATDVVSGIYRFAGGGPEEGINADKLDDLHAREHYHKPADAANPTKVDVKAPPPGRGLNADTLDSFHGREAYHGIQPEVGTGLNADTLDGVHKLNGPRRNPAGLTPVQEAANFAVLTTELSGGSLGTGTNGAKLKVEAFDTRGLSLGAVTVTTTTTDSADQLGQLLAADLTQAADGDSLHQALWVSHNPVGNVLTFTSKKVGERNQLTLEITLTDAGADPVRIKVQGESDTELRQYLKAGLVPPLQNPVLGVDADMLDGVHADTGHFGVPRDIEGQSVSSGINADLLDGLHARNARPGSDVQSTVRADGSVATSTPYLPVADGITKATHTRATFNVPAVVEPASDGPTPTAGPYNLTLAAGTTPGNYALSWKDATLPDFPWVAGNQIALTDPAAGKILVVLGPKPPAAVPQTDAITVAVGGTRNPNLDADTLDGLQAVDLAYLSTTPGASLAQSRVRLSDAFRRGDNHIVVMGAELKAMSDRGDFTADPVRWGSDGGGLVDMNAINGDYLYILRTSDNTLHDTVSLSYNALHDKPTIPAASTVTHDGTYALRADNSVKLSAGYADSAGSAGSVTNGARMRTYSFSISGDRGDNDAFIQVDYTPLLIFVRNRNMSGNWMSGTGWRAHGSEYPYEVDPGQLDGDGVWSNDLGDGGDSSRALSNDEYHLSYAVRGVIGPVAVHAGKAGWYTDNHGRNWIVLQEAFFSNGDDVDVIVFY